MTKIFILLNLVDFMNERHQNWDLKTSFFDWWRSRSYIWGSPSDWSFLMNEIEYKSWKFSRYMTNCDITNSVYSFDRNLATIWVGINWYTFGFFQNFDLLVHPYVSPSCFSVYTWYPQLPIAAVKEFVAIFK